MACAPRRRTWLAGVVALTVPVALLPATDARAAEPWWCAPGATLSATALPDVLPVSACSVAGRVIVSPRGLAVVVPGVGHGVASSGRFTDGTEDLTVWADAYAVHVGGDQYAAALGYLDALRAYAGTGAGDTGDLGRMASAVHDLVVVSVDRVRTDAVPASALLDAAETVAAFGERPAADVVTAAGVVAAQLRAAFERDESPAVGDLPAMAEDVRTVLRAGVVDPATAERALHETLTLRNATIGQQATTGADDRLATSVVVLGSLVRHLRDAIEDAVVPDVASPDTERYEATLADLSDYFASVAGDGSPVTVPMPGVPSAGDPSDGTASTAAPPACADGTRAPYYPDRAHWRRGLTIGWYYNHSDHYPGYTGDGYAWKIAEAFDNITRLNDDCGYSWRPNIANRYLGFATQTSMQPVDSQDRCQRDTDGKNVVGWRALPPRLLARTCVYRSATVVNGFDIAIARNLRWNIPEIDACEPQSPYQEYDVESVLTHEFGHAVALGHVDEAAHGNLTMSTLNNGPCTRGERTPGYGDAVGLAVLYTRA